MKLNRYILSILFFTASLLSLILSIKAASTAKDITLLWEAESAEEIISPFEIKADSQASGGRFVQISQGKGKLIFSLWIERPGKYTLWGRGKWTDGCNDSVLVTINGDHKWILGNDANYGIWHWVKGSSCGFHKGYNKIFIEDVERTVQVDSFLLTTNQKDKIQEIDKAIFNKNDKIEFNDDFYGNWQKTWTHISGNWEIKDRGNLQYLEQTNVEPSFLISGEPYWRDYSMQAAVRFGEEGSLGLLFYYQDIYNHYLVRTVVQDGDTVLQVVKVLNGVDYILGDERIAFKPNQWYLLRVEILGNDIQVLRNNKSVFKVHDINLNRGMVGLFTSNMRSGNFDDIEVLSIDKFSVSTFVGRGEKLVEIVNHKFENERELEQWRIVRGAWQIEEEGSLKGSEESLIFHNRVLYGDFDVIAKVNFSLDTLFSFIVGNTEDGFDGLHRFKIKKEDETIIIGLIKGYELVKNKIVEVSGKECIVNLKRNKGSYAIYLNDLPSLEIDTEEFELEGAVQVGFELDQGTLTLSSFKISEVPYYHYSSWDAPVDWEAQQGSIKMGHVDFSAINGNKEAIIWNENNFKSEDVTFEIHLYIDMNVLSKSRFIQDNSLELIVCNQGNSSINGYGLKIEMPAQNTYLNLDTQDSIKVYITLSRAGIDIASTLLLLEYNTLLEDHTPLIGLRKKNSSIIVYLNNKEIIRYNDPNPIKGQRLGLIFFPIESRLIDTLRIIFIRVFRVFQ